MEPQPTKQLLSKRIEVMIGDEEIGEDTGLDFIRCKLKVDNSSPSLFDSYGFLVDSRVAENLPLPKHEEEYDDFISTLGEERVKEEVNKIKELGLFDLSLRIKIDDSAIIGEEKLKELASKYQEHVRRYLAIAQGWSYRARYILECITVKVDTISLEDGNWLRFSIETSDQEVLRCIRIVEACKNAGCDDDVISLDFSTSCVYQLLTGHFSEDESKPKSRLNVLMSFSQISRNRVFDWIMSALKDETTFHHLVPPFAVALFDSLTIKSKTSVLEVLKNLGIDLSFLKNQGSRLDAGFISGPVHLSRSSLSSQATLSVVIGSLNKTIALKFTNFSKLFDSFIE